MVLQTDIDMKKSYMTGTYKDEMKGMHEGNIWTFIRPHMRAISGTKTAEKKRIEEGPMAIYAGQTYGLSMDIRYKDTHPGLIFLRHIQARHIGKKPPKKKRGRGIPSGSTGLSHPWSVGAGHAAASSILPVVFAYTWRWSRSIC